MPDATTLQSRADILAEPAAGEAFAAIPDPDGDGRDALKGIAAKIGRTRKPQAPSDIPAGATYLAQFAVHDIDLRSREDVDGAPRLDLALIYGDGPRHDAFAYQVPDGPGEPRSLLRIGRARPSWNSPAWGAARDLPRAACPHLDANGAEAKTEVLVPNSFSDSNLLLGQMQTLWALLHNAVAGGLAASVERSAERFEAARRITRHVYRAALIEDVLGTWLLPALRPRYVRPEPQRLSRTPLETLPRVFMAGAARIGHGLVREIYALNDRRPNEGLRSLIRHTSTGRPDDMPLTEDWLVDFSRFFDMGDRKAQRARGLGPHAARPFALGGGVGLDAPSPSDGLVLRDLVACSRSGLPSLRTLVARIRAADPDVLEGCFAQDENHSAPRIAAWLGEAGLAGDAVRALAQDPPLVLFLMLEAEADAGGRSLGALGSILMAETLTGALPAPAPAEELARAEASVFRGPVPGRMAEVIAFLQRHHQFPDGARLHPAAPPAPPIPLNAKIPETSMLDDETTRRPAGLVEVADYIELGRLVADWTRDADARPCSVGELAVQLDGIAQVPEGFKAVKFVESEPDVLVIRLPAKDLMEQTLTAMDTPLVGERYMLPKFYDDIYQRHFGPVMTPLDTFLARLGDYTIAQCR